MSLTLCLSRKINNQKLGGISQDVNQGPDIGVPVSGLKWLSEGLERE